MPQSAPTSSVTTRLVKGAGWVMTAQVIINLVSFASSIVLARLLMPEDFGLVAIALGVSAVVTALTSMPLSEALIQINDIEDDHFHSAFTLGFIRAMMLTLLLAGAAWPVAALYEDSRLAPIMLLLAVQAFIGGFYSARWPMIQKQLSFAPDAIAGVVTRVATMLASVVIAYLYRSYWAIVAPLVLMQLLSVVITHLYAPYLPRLRLSKVREIWSFSIWMTFSSVLTTVNARIDSLVLGGVLGQREVGFYSYADEKARMPTRELSTPLIRLLFPGLTAVRHDPARLAAAYQRTLTVIFAVCVPAGAGFGLVADMFVHVLLGPKWIEIIPIMQVLAFTFAFENLVTATAPLAMAMGATRALFVRDLMTFAFRVPLIITGLLLFGITGLLGARVLSTLASVLLNMLLAKQIVHVSIRRQFLGCARTFVAVGGMCAGVIAFKMALPAHVAHSVFGLLATIAVGGVAYIACHLGVWILRGRPAGPETDLIVIFNGVLRKLGRFKKPQPGLSEQ
ncbi:lipopolysaccharide biosynthesis protein [Sphingobium sp. B8D3A]|uniref:lipopolysaccharide biosynthesis protein n=1 Tax=Sphingobium sp. B8D3A TaxID=2940584 RepID=UPI0022241E71|nr:lipopolysaccharide biosynthesis protein [Sphingobium sp. B8D3A]MCW2410662.1 O-antigen/teichoic acid export membrane protein [Sphingobium sp. B8D3D]